MLDEIKSLPPLPASIVRIQELCMRNDTNIDELSKVIESDPMLSANILKSVNSPLYGMSKEISSIPQAIMLFGISMIRGFAAANAIKKSIAIDLSPYKKTIDDLGRVSTLQSALVREWYRIVDKSMLPLLQSTAFLMELGKLGAALKVINTGEAEKFASEMESEKSLLEIERCYIGQSSYAIAGMMFRHWNFESALTEALDEIGNSESNNPYARVLSVVCKAVNLREELSEKSLAEAREAIGAYGLDLAAFEEAVLNLKSK